MSEKNGFSGFFKPAGVKTVKTAPKKSTIQLFKVTRYYSPTTGQAHYYQGQTYKQDVTTNCGYKAIGNDDCMYPAHGGRFTQEESARVVACGRKYPAYTKFNIEGYGRVVCRDRGGAIGNGELDLRAGEGETGLNYIENTLRPAGYVKVTQILYP